MTEVGVFTISLDLELAWGSFDRNGIHQHGAAYRRTPEVVERLCELFERHDVPATWAVVAHLLEDCDGRHASSEVVTAEADTDVGRRRAEWLASSPCSSDIDRRLWYAPEVVDTVRSTPGQDVGLHGYGHLVFDDHSREAAAAELEEAVRVASAEGLDPVSFVFPRNRVAHVDLLADHGIEVYRGRDARWYEQRPVPNPGRRVLRFVDEAAAVTPPTVVPTVEQDVVRVPGSQVLRPRHGGWQWTSEGTQRRRAIAGIDRAISEGEVFHLWFHPFNLGVDPDPLLEILDKVLAHAGRLRRRGDLDILTMRQVAVEMRTGRWSENPRRRRYVTTDTGGVEP